MNLPVPIALRMRDIVLQDRVHHVYEVLYFRIWDIGNSRRFPSLNWFVSATSITSFLSIQVIKILRTNSFNK